MTDIKDVESITISTHTPLARRDASVKAQNIDCTKAISTHTPLARRDNNPAAEAGTAVEFQLTRLLRGVTWTDLHIKSMS